MYRYDTKPFLLRLLFLSKSWQVYKRNADQLSADLMKAFPDAKVLINDTKPRSKSYELSVIKEDGEGWWKEMQLPVIYSLAVAMLLIIIFLFLFCFVRVTDLDWNKERSTKETQVCSKQWSYRRGEENPLDPKQKGNTVFITDAVYE